MSKEKVSLSDIIMEVSNKINRETHVALPAIIDKYDFKTQKANVKINIKQMYDGQAIDMPVIPNVPVIFPSSGGASLTMPVKAGDGCIIVFCDSDIKNWLLGGNNVNPQTTRSHNLSDAVAIIGLNNFTKISGAENNEDMLLSYAGSKLRFKAGGIVDIHNAKEINIKTDNLIINCSSDVNITAKNANVTLSAAATIKAASAKIETTGDISATCANAIIKASGAINTTTPEFTQNGNMKISGNIEVTGTSKLTGNTDCSATITGSVVKAGSVDLATHTHNYKEPVVGSEPTAAVPSVTGTAN
jgi:phage gp45-like